MTIKQRAKKIKMLILDIDGVMTDGRIIYDSKGNELKCFNVLDGMGLAVLKQIKMKVVLVTAKGSRAVLRRARDIGVTEVWQNAHDKLKPYRQILKKHKLKNEDICFVGDDLVDLSVMKRAGLSVAVANACPEAKRIAHYVTKKEGGKGAVREIIEIILRAQNIWPEIIRKFLR